MRHTKTRDTVIPLYLGEAPGVAKAMPGPGTVTVRLEASAPEVEAEAKLWNPEGRAPILLAPLFISGKSPHEWRIPQSIDELDGCTVTWWVRLATDQSTRFKVNLEVQRGGKALPEGTFVCSGPLEAAEMQERSGRFHFKVINEKTGTAA
jgi:hypothetical protein